MANDSKTAKPTKPKQDEKKTGSADADNNNVSELSRSGKQFSLGGSVKRFNTSPPDADSQEQEERVNNLDRSHPDNADALTLPRQVRTRPGRLETSGTITLQTRQAHRLFYGRRMDRAKGIFPIVGLVRFAKNVGDIWNAAEADDPYADMVLLEIEAAFEEAKDVIDSQLKTVGALIDEQMEGIEVETMHSVQPVKLDVQFYSPWAYRGAMLLSRYDRLVLACMTARQVGLMLDDDWESTVVRAGSRIRHVFELSRRWVSTGVTRDDVAANNQVAQRAEQTYSKKMRQILVMPEDVMRGETRAKLAPKVKKVG